MFDAYLREALTVVIIASAVPLLSASAIGLLVGVIQTATQLQEQTISYVLKISASAAAMFVCWGWLSDLVVRLTSDLFNSFTALGRM